jgi:serine/threonine protein kinase
MKEKNYFETLTNQTLVSQWNLAYKQKRFENWEQEQLPQYCFFYEIQHTSTKNMFLNIIWFADKEDFLAFLIGEFPLYYISHFTNYYTDNPSFKTDLEYFFKHDATKMESAINGYRAALSKCNEQIDAQQLTKIAEKYLYNPNWFKERNQRFLFLGEVSLLASCNHPAILNLIDIFTSAKKRFKIDADIVHDMIYFFNISSALEDLESNLSQTILESESPLYLRSNHQDYLKRTQQYLKENLDLLKCEVLITVMNEKFKEINIKKH